MKLNSLSLSLSLSLSVVAFNMYISRDDRHSSGGGGRPDSSRNMRFSSGSGGDHWGHNNPGPYRQNMGSGGFNDNDERRYSRSKLDMQGNSPPPFGGGGGKWAGEGGGRNNYNNSAPVHNNYQCGW